MANLKKNAVSASEFRYCMSLDNAWMGFGFDRNLGPDSMLSGAKTLDRAGCPFSIVGAWECGALSVSGPACYGWCIGWELHGTTVSGRWKGDQTCQPHPSIRQSFRCTARCERPMARGHSLRWASSKGKALMLQVSHGGPWWANQFRFCFPSATRQVQIRVHRASSSEPFGCTHSRWQLQCWKGSKKLIGDTWGWYPCSSLYASTMAKAE